jgi:hypothetical protein
VRRVITELSNEREAFYLKGYKMKENFYAAKRSYEGKRKKKRDDVFYRRGREKKNVCYEMRDYGLFIGDFTDG